MNFDNLPQDKNSQAIALNAERNALVELVKKFQFDGTVSSFVMGTLHNELELVEKCLEFGVDDVKAEQYEAEAKADHRTSEQFLNV